MDLNTAIDVIESVAGFADADTSVGEAWAVVMAQLNAAPAPAGEVIQAYQAGRRDAEADARQAAEAAEDEPAGEDVAELALNELEQTVILLMPVTGHKKIKRFDTIRAALKRLQELEDKADLSPAPAPAGEVAYAAHVRRMCDIILDNTFGNEELDSLALLVGHHPDVLNASPAPAGEVAELVLWLRETAASLQEGSIQTPRLTRAADLLERLASPTCLVLDPSPESIAALKAAGPGRIELLTEDAQVIEPAKHTILVPARVPVAVDERPWERDGWCDEQGQCWMGDPGGGGFIPSWRLCRPEDAPRMRVSLPAHALPLPSGEPQP